MGRKALVCLAMVLVTYSRIAWAEWYLIFQALQVSYIAARVEIQIDSSEL